MRPFRLAVAGSVDDGKSTLLGRLLHDSERLFTDEAEAVRRASGDEVNLAFFTDGLITERAKGITLDVAWRHFVVPGSGERLLLADVPGHSELIRNMATGASVADAALVLVDVMRGVQPQTRRHLVMLSGLGVKSVTLVLNKMDGVGFKQLVFDELVARLAALAQALGLEANFIPVAALTGDNVVHRSARLAWFGGPTLLEALRRSAPASAGPFVASVQLATDSSGWTALHRLSGEVVPTRLHTSDGNEVSVLELSPLSRTQVRLSRALARGVLVSSEPVSLRDEGEWVVTWIAAESLKPNDSFSVLQHGRSTRVRSLEVISVRALEDGSWREGQGVSSGDVALVRVKLERPTWVFGPAILVNSLGQTVGGLVGGKETTRV